MAGQGDVQPRMRTLNVLLRMRACNLKMQIPETEWRNLSHRERRVLINKERRRRRRLAAALKREEEQTNIENQPGYLERLATQERLEEETRRQEEAKRLLEHEVWLERERAAQEQFRVKREREEQALKEKEERERLIREEWELLQKREKEAEERRDKLRQRKEERLQEALATETRPAVEKPTHNPLAPEGYIAPDTKNYGTERDSRNCSFFLKTGACRFGDTCSRHHPHPTSSTTLLIPGMYASLGLREWGMDDRDDSALEYEEGDMYEHFRSFYDDVLHEFTSVGMVTQFKVCCNYEPHLRGNVYVQYKSEDECRGAFQKFNGRWYAQRQLSCQFCPVQKWRNAICGLYSQKRCPKGKHCNFLHVFRNPGGIFSRADRDLPPLSPNSLHSRRSSWTERRRGSQSRSRSRECQWRHDSRDHSRERSRDRNRHDQQRRRPRRRRRSHSREARERSTSRKRRHSSSTRRTSLNSTADEPTLEAEEDERKNRNKKKKKRKKKSKKRKRSDDDDLSPSSISSSRRHHKHKHTKTDDHPEEETTRLERSDQILPSEGPGGDGTGLCDNHSQ